MNASRDIPEVLKRWPGHTGNWHRWPNDRGTLNLLTPEVTMRGLRASRTGEVITCSRTVRTEDPVHGASIASHEMTRVGKWDKDPTRNVQATHEMIHYRVHGVVNTHIDAFSHVGYEGYAFNGRPFEEMVTMEQGALHCGIGDALSIVTRGVFVDVAAARGIPYLEPADSVMPRDVEAVADQLLPGDAIIMRLGQTLNGGHGPTPGGLDSHGTWAGLHPDTIELFASKDVTVVASDSVSDTFPSPVIDRCKSPIHVLCLAFYGMPLLHNMDLEALAAACARTGRNDFLFMVSSINFPRATGSFCTPVAVL